MIIRSLQDGDIEKLKEIHERFFKDEFPFPDFERMVCAFVTVDDDNRIISGGGVKTIAESILITDKEFTPKDRRLALLEMLQASMFMSQKMGFEQLHAFVQNEKWYEQLKRYGFNDCKGKVVYI